MQIARSTPGHSEKAEREKRKCVNCFGFSRKKARKFLFPLSLRRVCCFLSSNPNHAPPLCVYCRHLSAPTLYYTLRLCWRPSVGESWKIVMNRSLMLKPPPPHNESRQILNEATCPARTKHFSLRVDRILIWLDTRLFILKRLDFDNCPKRLVLSRSLASVCFAFYTFSAPRLMRPRALVWLCVSEAARPCSVKHQLAIDALPSGVAKKFVIIEQTSCGDWRHWQIFDWWQLHFWVPRQRAANREVVIFFSELCHTEMTCRSRRIDVIAMNEREAADSRRGGTLDGLKGGGENRFFVLFGFGCASFVLLNDTSDVAHGECCSGVNDINDFWRQLIGSIKMRLH